jgi:hypothetical protein
MEAVTKCAICMNDYDTQKSKVSLECGHGFHYQCLLKWNLQSSSQTNHKSCPMCRTDIGISDILDESVVVAAAASQQPSPLQLQVAQSNNFEDKTVREISGIDQGLFICCRDCGDKLIPCCTPLCSSHICNCEYKKRDYRWETREFYCPSNPYSNIEYTFNPTRLFNELPIAHCSRCFENRDGIIYDYLCGVYDWENLLEESEQIEAYYYKFYTDSSEHDNTELYESYPTFTYDEFKTYISQGYSQMMHEYDEYIHYINSTGEEVIDLNHEGFQNELILEDEFNEAVSHEVSHEVSHAVSHEVINPAHAGHPGHAWSR